ncbi:hypothetical protein BJX76DRAFT_10126 [Aspergillus varians]
MESKATLRPCKVIVVGGGVTGLALALMLEKTGIDYILLEAYKELVGDATGGVAMLPTGLRILDQLGCYEELLDFGGGGVDTICTRDQNGEVVVSSDGWAKLSSERYGYPLLWVDRPVLLQVMYDRISDQSKLLAGKRVETVRHVEDAVEVVTVDGSIYRGDIVIGADGTHSRVRQEMVRHATDLGVSHAYDHDDAISATYGCMFGTSSTVPGIPPRYLGFGANKHFSYIIGTGPENKTFWALTHKLGKTTHGADILQFTEEDKQQRLQEHWDDRITPEVRFSDLHKYQQRVVHTPLHEGVHQKWHSGRIITLGDASHKMTIVLAQGGNLALEAAVALTNNLVGMLSLPTSGGMSMDEIRCIFDKVQDQRMAPASILTERSHEQQRLNAMETPELEEMLLRKYPQAFPGVVLQRWDATFPLGISLKMLDIPARPRTVPYEDER